MNKIIDTIVPKEMIKIIKSRAFEYCTFKKTLENMKNINNEEDERKYNIVEDEKFKALTSVQYYCYKYKLDYKVYIDEAEKIFKEYEEKNNI